MLYIAIGFVALLLFLLALAVWSTFTQIQLSRESLRNSLKNIVNKLDRTGRQIEEKEQQSEERSSVEAPDTFLKIASLELENWETRRSIDETNSKLERDEPEYEALIQALESHGVLAGGVIIAPEKLKREEINTLRDAGYRVRGKEEGPDHPETSDAGRPANPIRGMIVRMKLRIAVRDAREAMLKQSWDGALRGSAPPDPTAGGPRAESSPLALTRIPRRLTKSLQQALQNSRERREAAARGFWSNPGPHITIDVSRIPRRAPRRRHVVLRRLRARPGRLPGTERGAPR